MPYKLSDFRRLGYYEERPTRSEGISFEGGKIIKEIGVSERILNMLNTVGGIECKGDRSRQDAVVITSLLRSGMNAANTYATFED